jgi:RecA-family ATPase
MPDAGCQPSLSAKRPEVEFIDFAALDGLVPPPREFVIEPWLPRGHVTLLGGVGGVGKTLLAQQAATAAAVQLEWLGKVPKPGASIGLFCEDDTNELWRRQVDICAALDVPLSRVARRIRFEGRAGKANTLTWNLDGVGVQDSPVLVALREYLNDLELSQSINLVVLDNAAQMFPSGDGGESDRGRVTAFLNHLTGLAIEFNCAVLLLVHPAKAEGSEYSGSTAWENAVRSRLFLFRESPDDPNSRVILSRSKANYASRGDQTAFVWERGAFSRTDGRRSALDEARADSRVQLARGAVLDALAWFATRRLGSSHKRQASNFLPRLMKQHGRGRDFSVAEIAEALNTLIADQGVEVDAFLWRDGNRNSVKGIRVTETQADGV